jgi:NAD(P)-dependent dehydrogenase (short-subunit alcohol dehydrogenase family)
MGNILNNRVAVVTGAGRGIGRAIALHMADEGAKVVVNDYGVGPDGSGLSSLPAERVVQEIRNKGGESVANTDSVATSEGGENIIRTAVETFGRLDILVNNAGIVLDKMIFNLSEQDWDKVIKVNLYGHFNCTRPASELMRKQQWGRIINMSSGAGLGQTIGCANYAAAKEGVVGFTRAVARDMVKYKVTCNAIRPLALTRHFDEKRKDAWLRQGKTQAVREMERSAPEDVAAFVLYLASEGAASITGKTFFVGGGTISLFSEPERLATIQREGAWSVDLLQKLVPESLMVPRETLRE